MTSHAEHAPVLGSATVFDPYRVRSSFPILAREVGHQPLVFMDSAASAQRPQEVLDAMDACYKRFYANVHRGIHELSEQSTEQFEAARSRVAQWLHADNPESIILTPGCTAAINLVAQSWGKTFLKPGDLVVATQMEHHANLVPWFQLKEERGIEVQLTHVTDDYLLDLELYAKLLERKPKLVVVTAVSNVLGTVNPIEQIVQMAHDAGAIVLVDAAQAVPHQRVDVQRWDSDFLVFSGHKVMGPTGIGVLYGRRSILEQMPPFMGGGGMIDTVTSEGFTPGPVPTRFEAGTPPFVEAMGLAAAIDFLDRQGIEQVAAHEHRLVTETHQRLESIPGLRIIGPALDKKSGIVSFTLDGFHAHDVAQVLNSHGVAVRAGHHCAMPLHQRFGLTATVRASFYLYNTSEEIETLGVAIEDVSKRLTRKRR